MTHLLYSAIQKAIISTINRPDFEAALPPLSDKTWLKLLSTTHHSRQENERLEFLGDALMYATIGRVLYAQIPDGTPHLYTLVIYQNVRAALHSNTTFSHLAERLDILAVSGSVLRALTTKRFGEGASISTMKSKPQIKATADLFETIIGAYYLERGFESLCGWVQGIYKPLILVAEASFSNFRPIPNKQKRKRGHDVEHRPRLVNPRKKPRLVQSTSTSRNRPPDLRFGLLRSPQVNDEHGTRPHILPPAAPHPSTTRLAGTAAPIVIDLTLASDSSEDEGTTLDILPRNHETWALSSSMRRFLVEASPQTQEDCSSDDESTLEQMLVVVEPDSD
ncbi:uncharacterized protein FIBRA_07409 [Fibroporia radiculosa]|uniref:RNase III domain-containing protein n=1 Tax=Fibroporia radiculosa TaxID=599839 RepID=J4GUX6_9APHY|nr:uncharacterized protein FIBRA_07409 [Fibroporia radiculosa]CCM05200.1 predicted protein [Fibroporia radiculosa]